MEYDHNRDDQLNQNLRIYFNNLDAFLVAISTPQNGTTANRPTQNLQIGQFYYDTTLGIPIFWNGTVWKNSSGTTV